MKPIALISLIAGATAVIGGIAYDEKEKSKCAASGGTWQGLFKSPHCVAGGGSTGTNPPAPPTNIQVSNVQVKADGTWTADVAFTGSPGATSYKPILDGQVGDTLPGTATSFTIQGTGVNQQHVVGVAACN